MLRGGTLRQAFGTAIVARRKELGIGQEAAADRAKVHRTYLSEIERGKSSPTLDVIEVLAEALEISVADLMARTEGGAARAKE